MNPDSHTRYRGGTILDEVTREESVKYVDRRLGIFLLVASGVVLAVNALTVPAFRVDDSYITFRYSTNLANGFGLVFNSGERVEGISNPLWAVLLAAFVPLKLGLLEVARCLSAFSALACLYLVFGSVKRATGSAVTGAFGSLLLASHMGFSLWIYPGLETLFFSFLLTLLIYQILWLAEAPSSSGVLATVCVLCFFLPAVRPESILFTLAIAGPGLLAAFGGTRQRALIWPLVSLAIGFLCLELLRFSYYGEWLPNTYYAKVDSGYATLTRLNATVDILENHPVGFFLTVAGLVLLGGRLATRSISLKRFGGPKRALVAMTVCVILADVFFLWIAGMDWMPGWRYFLPVLPALCILAAFALFEIFEGLRLRVLAPWAGAVVGLVAALALVAQFSIRAPTAIAKAYAQEAFVARSELSVRQLRTIIEPGSTVAIAAAGVIPYSLPKMRFLDMLGLNDFHIARLGSKFSNFWEKTDVDSVLERRPEFILIRYQTEMGEQVPDINKGCWPALYEHPQLRENYLRIATLEANNFWLYKRIDPVDPSDAPNFGR